MIIKPQGTSTQLSDRESRLAGRLGGDESAEEVRVRAQAAVRGLGLPGAVRLAPPHPRVRAPSLPARMKESARHVRLAPT